MVNFTTVACRICSRLKRYKTCKNRLRLAKVIVKNILSRFYGWLRIGLYHAICYSEGDSEVFRPAGRHDAPMG